MSDIAERKIIQYLAEAQAAELALVQTLTAHVAMTPSGRYRTTLEKHLRETRDHAERIERRLEELGEERGIVQAGYELAQSAVGQALAFSKLPIDLVRGTGGEEKVLKNIKDEIATEAEEIATYSALEELARRLDDVRTAELAASIRAEEQHMLERLLDELPRHARDVVSAEVDGDRRYDLLRIGAVDAARVVATGAARTIARRATRAARRAEQATDRPMPRRSSTGRAQSRTPKRTPRKRAASTSR